MANKRAEVPDLLWDLTGHGFFIYATVMPLSHYSMGIGKSKSTLYK
jgi:hypothetical protein